MRDIWKQHHRFIGFVTAIVICLLINLVALTCTNHTYKDGQQRILMSYQESLALIDSLQKENEDALNRVLTEREKTITKILSDTLIDTIHGLCPEQRNAVRKYVRPYLEITTRELNIQERIKSDPKHEYVLLRDEIKSLLQLEFNKLQNEYEVLEIWAAILTIVFLIFSFYSFFKTEKIEEDGRQSISRINNIEDDARNNLGDLQNMIKIDFDDQKRRFSEVFSSQMEEQQNRYRNKEEEINRRFQEYQTRMEELFNELRIHGEDQPINDTIENDADEHNNTNNNEPE